MALTRNDHTFAVCAYGESRYLEECVLSVIGQDVRSNVIITTSTPNVYIENIARRYSVPLFINSNRGGIASDWNYAYHSANTKLVTLAHQDDIYSRDYVKNVLEEINKETKPLIAFTDYNEIRNGKVIEYSKLLRIKRYLLFPLRNGLLRKSRFVRRRILSMGSCICCPSVTMVKSNLPEEIFRIGMKSNIDWEAWEKISRLDGSFVYCRNQLMSHRIHQESTTTEIISGGIRCEEDLQMFCKFWPKGIARLLEHFYQRGENSNNL